VTAEERTSYRYPNIIGRKANGKKLITALIAIFALPLALACMPVAYCCFLKLKLKKAGANLIRPLLRAITSMTITKM
jgi:hypothetical protein